MNHEIFKSSENGIQLFLISQTQGKKPPELHHIVRSAYSASEFLNKVTFENI